MYCLSYPLCENLISILILYFIGIFIVYVIFNVLLMNSNNQWKEWCSLSTWADLESCRWCNLLTCLWGYIHKSSNEQETLTMDWTLWDWKQIDNTVLSFPAVACCSAQIWENSTAYFCRHKLSWLPHQSGWDFPNPVLK